MSCVFNCNTHQTPNLIKEFLNFIDVENDEFTNLETEIDGQVYHENVIIEEIDVVIRIIRKNWWYLQNSILNETSIEFSEVIRIRTTINKILKLVISCLKGCECEGLKTRYITSSKTQMKTLVPLILPTSELEKEIYLKLTSKSVYSKDKCPVYQYFHTFQDIHYYLLLYHYVTGDYDQLQHQLEFIMKDMVLLSEKAYKQKGESPFVCPCNEKFWLILQLLAEKALGEDSFWLIFNKTVENFNNNEYILWLLSAVANLQAFNSDGAQSDRIRPNFTLLDTTLKNIVATAEFNSSIFSVLKSVQILITDLWLKWSKIEVYQILWDYFSKRLNICVRTCTSLPLSELSELVDTILWAPKDCKQDFELFLSLLCMHLSEYPHHWGKMKGRIYSQLGPNKMKDLHQGGIFNVLLLFVCLAKVNFEDLCKKFLVFVENLPVEKKQTQLIWTFFSAFMLRHIRENRDLEPTISPFLKMLEDASTDHKSFHLIKTFTKEFDHIISTSTNLQLHQWLLINTWIHKYMASCYHPDLVTLLNILVKTIDHIDQEQVWCHWEKTFTDYVYSALKSSHSKSEITGILAGKIVILSPNLLSEAFTFFNSDAVSCKVAGSFLCVVLEGYPDFGLTPQQEVVALQTWGKFCLLARDGYEELTRKISKLEIVPDVIKTVLVSNKDPFCALIDHIGENIKQYTQSSDICRLCDVIFQSERWIGQYFNQPDNEAVVFRIYTCLGLAFFKIGSLLYDKRKASCPFVRLVTALLLPTELMLGKPINAYILQSIKKTWHLFFEATVYLNSANDPFIDRILREMVVRYIPHFATVDSPMLRCMDNEQTAEILLEKISSNFFKQTKEAESSVYKALKLTNDFILSTTSVVLLKMVINKTVFGIFEIIMFHSQKNMALSVVTHIVSLPLFHNVKDDFEEVVMVVTEKHLAFNTTNYFQLLVHLSKIVPSSMKSLSPRIKQHVAHVEKMRGVGYDKTLRLSLQRFEAGLIKQ